MALTPITLIGRNDVPAAKQDTSSLNLTIFAADITSTATADYSTGYTFGTTVANALGLNLIVDIISAAIYTSAGALRIGMVPLWDKQNTKLRFFFNVDPAAAGGANVALAEILSANLAANDVIHIVAIGI